MNEFKRVVGIEPTPDLAQTCRKKGIEVIESPIEKINFETDQLFDVVVNFIAFTPEEVKRDIELFSGICNQYIFIS